MKKKLSDPRKPKILPVPKYSHLTGSIIFGCFLGIFLCSDLLSSRFNSAINHQSSSEPRLIFEITYIYTSDAVTIYSSATIYTLYAISTLNITLITIHLTYDLMANCEE
ncbi:hypothetical protein L1887_02876 [Cichorium endivia]|nr:hypothetical protein L1887_02876 [Cichorium endivia]